MTSGAAQAQIGWVHVVAIHRLRGNEELLARELAGVLGKTVAEARGRVWVAAAGPALVGTFAAGEPAAALARELAEHGFETLSVGPRDVESDARRWRAGHVALAAEGLRATAGGRVGMALLPSRHAPELEIAVPYAEIELLLCGTRTTVERQSKLTTESKFSPVVALLSGGLLLKRRSLAQRTVWREERERFLHVHAAGRQALAFCEHALAYRDMGLPLAATSSANFALLVAELRRRCPGALFDDRLNNRIAQSQILGSALAPAEHLDVAISVLTRALQRAG